MSPSPPKKISREFSIYLRSLKRQHLICCILLIQIDKVSGKLIQQSEFVFYNPE